MAWIRHDWSLLYSHGTDSGPPCPHCRATVWMYGYSDDGATLETLCTSCGRQERYPVRAALPDVRQIRLQHDIALAKEALNHGS